MPELDFALLSDYVRAEGGVAHVIAGGIDTVFSQTTPTGRNVGLLLRVVFSRSECDRPHRLEVIFQGEDGERLAQVTTAVTPTWSDDLPAHWKSGFLAGVNLGVPLPRFGLYAFEILINDSLAKTIPLRVVQFETAGGETLPGAIDPADEG